jgi:HTH-type transcriptional regulator/antitoxin HipB
MKIIANTPAALAEILLSARKEYGLTQAQAASALGIGQPRLSALETTGTASISLAQMLTLLSLYGLELCVQSRDTSGVLEAREDRLEW